MNPEHYYMNAVKCGYVVSIIMLCPTLCCVQRGTVQLSAKVNCKIMRCNFDICYCLGPALKNY